MRLQYDQSEAKLAKQAQGLMITYWTQYYNLDGQKARVEQAKLSYQSEQNRLAAGMSTQSKVLSSKGVRLQCGGSAGDCREQSGLHKGEPVSDVRLGLRRRM